MKKILSLVVIGIHLVSLSAFGASEWAKIEPAGTRNASDIDTYVTTNNEALDRISNSFRENCALYYVSATSIGVKAGSVTCSNAAGSLKRFRTNTAVTSEDITTEVTGVGTYYVYAIADADATTFTLEVVTSASVPTSGTYYKRLGSFYASADDVIANDDGLVNDNNYYALRLGDWVSKSNNTVYQATTDGVATGIGSAGVNLIIKTDSANPPTTTRITNGAGASNIGSGSSPVKRGDYYKFENAATAYFIPLSREV